MDRPIDPPIDGSIERYIERCRTIGRSVIALLKVWCATTDAGSDVAHGRRLVAAAVSGSLYKLFFDVDCFMHQFHILVLGLLYGMDEFIMALFGNDGGPRYYTVLASVLHVWRDNCAEIYAEFKRQYGFVVAQASASKIPPRPISGRWGRKSKCEQYLLRADPTQVASVFDAVLNKRTYFIEHAADASADAAAPPAAPVDAGRGGRGRGRAGRGRRGRGRGRAPGPGGARLLELSVSPLFTSSALGS